MNAAAEPHTTYSRCLSYRRNKNIVAPSTGGANEGSGHEATRELSKTRMFAKPVM
ncbi:hypothetical protein RRSWK_05059 [Rhodopirellula sp. SWK7]|nr:hypothetical protein RRSWK_05059 [Rhodopirellula sp. SWK7]